MKMNYKTPEISVSKFNLENIITTSGAVGTEKTLQENMEADGYTVTPVSLAEINITL